MKLLSLLTAEARTSEFVMLCVSRLRTTLCWFCKATKLAIDPNEPETFKEALINDTIAGEGVAVVGFPEDCSGLGPGDVNTECCVS